MRPAQTSCCQHAGHSIAWVYLRQCHSHVCNSLRHGGKHGHAASALQTVLPLEQFPCMQACMQIRDAAAVLPSLSHAAPVFVRVLIMLASAHHDLVVARRCW